MNETATRGSVPPRPLRAGFLGRVPYAGTAVLQARLRAAEEGLPVIRSTPTGISALIDAHGLVLKSIPWQTAGFIDGELPAPLPQTFFGRFGNVIPLVLGFLLLIAAIALSRGARYRAI